jgi:membrane protein required for beta-lactamase induction
MDLYFIPGNRKPADKTKPYQEKIEIKQRELGPWREKIAGTQAAMNTAKSERDYLQNKVDSIQKGIADATEQKQQAVIMKGEKVGFFFSLSGTNTLILLDLLELQCACARSATHHQRLPAARGTLAVTDWAACAA